MSTYIPTQIEKIKGKLLVKWPYLNHKYDSKELEKIFRFQLLGRSFIVCKWPKRGIFNLTLEDGTFLYASRMTTQTEAIAHFMGEFEKRLPGKPEAFLKAVDSMQTALKDRETC